MKCAKRILCTPQKNIEMCFEDCWAAIVISAFALIITAQSLNLRSPLHISDAPRDVTRVPIAVQQLNSCSAVIGDLGIVNLQSLDGLKNGQGKPR